MLSRLLRQNYAGFYLHQHRRLISSTTTIVHKETLPDAAYKPTIVEKNKYKKWEASGCFRAVNGGRKSTFNMVLPPPNVTGKLHLGHALGCTVQDVIARRKRSMGFNVLWVPGMDHAGIATQGVVEKFLKSTKGLDRHSLGRERFNSEVWKWKEKHGNTISEQLRTLGCSVDWTRERFTMDPRLTKAVNTAFLKLFQQGLIYRKKALVNWCTALKSTVSDIEVENVPINGPTDVKVPGYNKTVKFGQLHNFAYKVFGTDEEIVVSTTMPETMLGDVAIAVHPNDDRYKHLVSKRAYHPFRHRTIPIVYDEFVDMKFGTGAVKITPAHSKVDYKVAQTHYLPILQVISEDGLIQNSGEFDNLQKYYCRDKIIARLKELDLYRSVTSHQMNLPICSRTGDVIEYLPKEQWFLSCTEMNKKVMTFLQSGHLKVVPSKYIKTWLDWAADDRDWCISRQLWWGHQIPAYKCSVGKDLVWVPAIDEETARKEASKFLRTMPDGVTAERDTDVLDTWFSSGLYPFAALGWPEVHYNADFREHYPLSLMATGHDILGFWVHRMTMLGLELTGKLPFNKVLLHGIICDSKGSKMSKSKGNVIDPMDVISGISIEDLENKATDMCKNGLLNHDELKQAMEYHKSNFSITNGIPECGVDALRFTLLSQDIKSHFVNFDVHICHANKLFCNKIWQSIKFMGLNYAKLQPTDDEITVEDLTFFDKWILSRLADMVDKVNKHMDDYDFHLATKALKTLIYKDFCDVYLEATKSGFNNNNHRIGYAHAHTLSAVLNTSLRCLNPFMIYVTEELIPKIPNFKENIIYNFNDLSNNCFDFPQFEDFKQWSDDNLEKEVEKVIDTLHLVRGLKGLYKISNKFKPGVRVLTTDETLVSNLKANKAMFLHLSKCSEVSFDDDIPYKHYVKGYLSQDTEVCIEVTGDDIDNTLLEARGALQKKIKKIEDSLAKLEAKFSSERYVTTVPQWTQVLEKEKLSLKKEELKQLYRLIK